MTTVYEEGVTGVVLAGGKARRMGGEDKGLININNKPMISYILDALKPQVDTILINANRNVKEYKKFGYEVLSDQLEDFQGPLAGIAAAMASAKTEYIFTCPCDGPLLHSNLVNRLAGVFVDSSMLIAVAHDGTRLQPLHALLKCDLYASLLEYLNSGARKIDHWYAQHPYQEVDCSDCKDCFMNINTPEERKQVIKKLIT